MYRTILLMAGAVVQTFAMDPSIRTDFFAGFAGDANALQRGLQRAQAAIADDPKAGEPLAWHGAALLFFAGQKLSAGDFGEGGPLWDKAMKELEQAGTLEPDNPAVLIPRAAAWFAASRGLPPDQSHPVLVKAVGDYQKVYDLQRSFFDTLDDHQRSELLFGLADGNNRLGNADLAHQYFEKLVAIGPQGGHYLQATSFLKTGSYEVKGIGCVGCHTAKNTGK